MKLNNLDILNIKVLIDNNESKRFPQPIMYALFKNQKEINESVEVYNKSLEALLDAYSQYVVVDESGNPERYENGLLKVVEEKEKDYFEELNSLLAATTDINLYTVDEDVFDYSEERYDSLPLDLMRLLSIKE